eukprot:CAMPEP_0196661218 /NCGR_PEP_ID=MMETSP1086-20130531/43278_1 /TAXON_ID=77921 /ORGANISM="Cyanoptyche  gloeocystis , Strain SAG4.97" /LENGTH=42 /DNA_ID= /DNA_START= /DNA_END= /DNA_ORIENTATION=
MAPTQEKCRLYQRGRQHTKDGDGIPYDTKTKACYDLGGTCAT